MTRSTLPPCCRVALPIPRAEPYSYVVPPGLADRVVPGARVVVPVRNAEMVGIVVEHTEESPEGLKGVLLAPDAHPLLSPALLDLSAWIAHHYGVSGGVALKAMMPGALWGRSKVVVSRLDDTAVGGGLSTEFLAALARRGGRASLARLSRDLARPVWEVAQRLARERAIALETVPPNLGPAPGAVEFVVLTHALPSLMERERIFGRARRQRELFELIDAAGGEMAVTRVRDEYGFARPLLRALVAKGIARLESRTRFRDPFASSAVPPPPEPTAEQTRAIERLTTLREGSGAVLFGVTGSGKTLVYLEAMRDAVARGEGAIVLVPEISLTPQTIARVRGVFGNTVAVLHSGLSDGERADAWRSLAAGKTHVAVGARSAVFAPVRQLALLVVDEEHDASYKNGEAPRYHARDVGLRRAHLEGARAVLGSATPSLDVWARPGLPHVHLPQRAMNRPLPPVKLLDLRSVREVAGCGPVAWSEQLDSAVSHRLARREQVILLLNRRGYAHYLQCLDCGEVCSCPSCSIALTVHRTPPRLRCHYCDHEAQVPLACTHCGGETQRTKGVGTQHLERWLSQRFPEARLARMDADTTGTKWSHARILDEFGRGEIDVLFGTQMIAKGLDFPGVTLVGVVNADTGLHLPDFRAAERTFQLIAQVAGRAGRGPGGGEVMVQTRLPEHYALTAAAAHDYEGFVAQEIEIRRAPAYPPHVALVNIVVSARRESVVSQSTFEVAEWVRGLCTARDLPVDVLGPAPAPIARIKDRWRWHVLLRSPDSGVLGRVMRYAMSRVPGHASRHIRIMFDRDPLSLL